MFEGPEDYPVLKYIVEHTEYTADYFPIEQAMEWLGDDGVVMDGLIIDPFYCNINSGDYSLIL